jgi:hypothetical protein
LVTGPLGLVAGEPDPRQCQLLCLLPVRASGYLYWRLAGLAGEAARVFGLFAQLLSSIIDQDADAKADDG